MPLVAAPGPGGAARVVVLLVRGKSSEAPETGAFAQEERVVWMKHSTEKNSRIPGFNLT